MKIRYFASTLFVKLKGIYNTASFRKIEDDNMKAQESRSHTKRPKTGKSRA